MDSQRWKERWPGLMVGGMFFGLLLVLVGAFTGVNAFNVAGYALLGVPFLIAGANALRR